MKVSFDFDQTLDKESVQKYAKELISKGVEVWICTSRFSNTRAPNKAWNNDLYNVAKEVGIKPKNVIFCEMADKYELLKEFDFIWHLDDDWTELDMINKNTKIRGISVFGNNTWKRKCNALIRPYLETI